MPFDFNCKKIDCKAINIDHKSCKCTKKLHHSMHNNDEESDVSNEKDGYPKTKGGPSSVALLMATSTRLLNFQSLNNYFCSQLEFDTVLFIYELRIDAQSEFEVICSSCVVFFI